MTNTQPTLTEALKQVQEAMQDSERYFSSLLKDGRHTSEAWQFAAELEQARSLIPRAEAEAEKIREEVRLHHMAEIMDSYQALQEDNARLRAERTPSNDDWPAPGVDEYPGNIVADRHPVTGKWVLWYLTDEQARKCLSALCQPAAPVEDAKYVPMLVEALLNIAKGAPETEPERYLTENFDDIASQAVDGFHWHIAEKIRAVLAQLSEEYRK